MSGNEYKEMTIDEFFEFIVRISYIRG